MISELKIIFPDYKIENKNNYIEITVDKKNIFKVIKELKENKKLIFDQLIDISAVDYPTNEKRFEIIYILLSMTLNKRIVLKSLLSDGDQIESITSIHKCANWPERECYDLFGLEFVNHPDLRRILTDYNFEGHPLRKDFPLTGHTEVRYDNFEKKVVYEPVKLNQEYRSFDYTSPWEGIPNTLEGDEKANKGNNEGN